jgi:adenylate cyclase
MTPGVGTGQWRLASRVIRLASFVILTSTIATIVVVTVHYRIGEFALQPDRRLLLDGDRRILLGARAFDVLLMLVERQGQLVTKEELLDRVWAGLIVEQNNLQVQISTLRKILGPTAIVTAPGRGYHFTLETSLVEDPDSRPGAVQANLLGQHWLHNSVQIPPIDLSIPDRPSIAVLAFSNLSGNPEHEYFTDGISEDIVTELSRFHELFVVARNSSFIYKGRAVDVRHVSKDLGVRYVVKGSIRMAAGRVRVTAQLIDATTGSHLWAERYDRSVEDIFAVQDEVTESIVRTIAPQIMENETQRILRRHPASLQGYELAVRAYAKVGQAFARGDPALLRDGIESARSALTIDADSALALFALALGQWQRLYLGAGPDGMAISREALDAAQRLIEVDRSSSHGFLCRGLLLANAVGRVGDTGSDPIDEALRSLHIALELNPHNAMNLVSLGFVEAMAGHSEEAIGYASRALRQSPRDPIRFIMYHHLSIATFQLGRYEQSVAYALIGLTEAPAFALLYVDLAASRVALGEIAQARVDMDRARQLWPGWYEYSIEQGNLALRSPELREKTIAHLRVAARFDAELRLGH